MLPTSVRYGWSYRSSWWARVITSSTSPSMFWIFVIVTLWFTSVTCSFPQMQVFTSTSERQCSVYSDCLPRALECSFSSLQMIVRSRIGHVFFLQMRVITSTSGLIILISMLIVPMITDAGHYFDILIYPYSTLTLILMVFLDLNIVVMSCIAPLLTECCT